MECIAAYLNQKLDVAQSPCDMNIKMATKDQHRGTWWTGGGDEFTNIPTLNQSRVLSNRCCAPHIVHFSK